MFNPETDIITHCTHCKRVMIVADYKNREPLNPYLVELGYKETGRFYCPACTRRIMQGTL